MNETAHYKKYVARQLGLKEAQFVPFPPKDEYPGIDPTEPQVSPTARPTPIIALGIRGSSTGGLPSGADQQGDISPTKVGGYDRVEPQDLNSKLVDKTPENPEIKQDSVPINNNPTTGGGVTHPHQIQVTANEEPQATTGASTDSDPTLKLKSAIPKGIDIDITEQGEEDEEENKQNTSDNAMIPATSLSEGKHKAGCKCGFCMNKGSFGKKKEEKTEAEEGKEEQEEKKQKELDETFKRHMVLMKEYVGLNESKCSCGHEASKCTCPPDCKCGCNKKDKVEECATCGCGNPTDSHDHDHGDKKPEDKKASVTKKPYVDKTGKEKEVDWVSMKEGKKARVCHFCKKPHPCACDKQDEEDAELQRKNPEEYRRRFGMKIDKKHDDRYSLDEAYAPPFSRMRGLAGLGKVVLSSNGQWTDTTVQESHPPGASNPFSTHWKMDKEKAGYVKVDEAKLKKVQETLNRKSKRGTLSEKELELVNRLNEVLKLRETQKKKLTEGGPFGVRIDTATGKHTPVNPELTKLAYAIRDAERSGDKQKVAAAQVALVKFAKEKGIDVLGEPEILELLPMSYIQYLQRTK